MIEWTDLDMKFGPNMEPVGGEVLFDHVDDDGTVRHFAVDRIVNWINQNTTGRVIIPINPAFAAWMYQGRGLEQHRLDRITGHDIVNYPVVMAHMPGLARDHPQYLLIDGSHRYYRAYQMGWRELPATLLPQEVWTQFLVRFPKEIDDFVRGELHAQVHEGKHLPSGIR